MTAAAKQLDERARPLIISPWPEADQNLIDPQAEAEIDWLIRAITLIRVARNQLNIPASSPLDLLIQGASPETKARLDRHHESLIRLARLSKIQLADTLPPGSMRLVVDEATFALPVAHLIDLEQERRRLDKEIAKAMHEMQRLDAKLANPQFLQRAPSHVIDEQRERRTEVETLHQRLQAALASFTT